MLRPVLLMTALAAPGIAQQEITVPAAYDSVDANSRFWIGGVSMPVLQQTIIGASHLQTLASRQITALMLRREAEDEAYVGGSAILTLKLSSSRRSPDSTSAIFADNVGGDETVVFSGTVTLPNAPSTPGPIVGWGAQETLLINFTSPFTYRGGDLCLEITGTPDPQQPVAWWPADAIWDGDVGSSTSVGSGCGPYGGPSGTWAGVSGPALVPGGTAQFFAWGTPGNLAFLAIADRAQANAMSLTMFGAVGCYAHVANVMGSMTTLFGPRAHPSAVALGGPAFLTIQLPNESWLLGATLGAQWFDLGPAGIYSSNGVRWSVATSVPTIDITLVSAHYVNGQPPTIGRVYPGRGHVMRFRYQ